MKFGGYAMKNSKTSIVTKFIVLALTVYATITLLSLQSQISVAEADRDALLEQVTVAAQENAKLIENLEQYSEESTEDIARSKLGLVSKGEIIFYDVSN